MVENASGIAIWPKNRDYSRWPAEEKCEKVSKMASEKFPGLKNHFSNFSWVSFLRWQRW